MGNWNSWGKPLTAGGRNVQEAREIKSAWTAEALKNGSREDSGSRWAAPFAGGSENQAPIPCSNRPKGGRDLPLVSGLVIMSLRCRTFLRFEESGAPPGGGG